MSLSGEEDNRLYSDNFIIKLKKDNELQYLQNIQR